MKVFYGILIIGVSILIAAVLILTTFNEYILRNESCKSLSGVVLLFFQPADLYEHLFLQEINFSKTGQLDEFEFINKYLGKHTIGIIFPKESYKKDVDVKQINELKAQVKIEFYADGELIVSKELSGGYSSFIGKEGKGMMFFIYECSSDVPIDKTIVCKLTVTKSDAEFQDAHKPIKLYIKKMSDL